MSLQQRWNLWQNWGIYYIRANSVQLLGQARLCNPMDCRTPSFPVHHQLPELTQTHVHWVGEAIQPSHPLWSPSPPAFTLPQHQGLFKWVNSSHQVAKVLEPHLSINPSKIQDWSPLGWIAWISLQFKGLSKSLLQHHSSKASTLWHSAFFTVQLSHPYMLLEKTIALTRRTFVSKV